MAQGLARRLLRGVSAAAALVVALVAPSAMALPPVPRAAVASVEVGPKVDGVLDDPVWALATPIGSLTQVEPVEGAKPTRPTEVRLLTDGDNLYIGVRCFDDDPGGIIARNMLRDGDLAAEDRIEIVIDTFHDKRNGYLFVTNALGLRRDGLIEGASVLINWDGIWNVKSRIDEQGWTAEFVIPYKTLSFHAGGDVWGFNLLRGIRGTVENGRWATPDVDYRFSEMSVAGEITGLAESQQGLGIDLVPSTSLRRVDDDQRLDGEDDERHYTRFTPSLDARYRITSSLTATGTVNTDFGQTPVDDVRVNLSRFSLLFPEKREFFLQDAGIFEFAEFTRDVIPFFSRKIGLSEAGEPVSVRGGGKLTGRVGPLALGLLGTHVRKQKHVGNTYDVEAKELGVARLKLNVLEESSVGVIGTWGDPQSDGNNWLVGADFLYRNSQFLEHRVLEGKLWMQKSRSYGTGIQCARDDGTERDCDREFAYGAQLSYPNDRFRWSLGVEHVQEDYDPALGFLRRGDVNRYFGSVRFRWRPEGPIKTLDANLFGVFLTGSDDPSTVKTVFTRFTLLDVQTLVGDQLRLFVTPQYEKIETEFNVFEDVVIGRGSYNFVSAGFNLTATKSRPLSGGLEVSGGQHFNGHRVRIFPRVEWRPNRYLLFSGGYQRTWFWLDREQSTLCGDDDTVIERCGNSFVVSIATGRFEVQFSPDLSWNTLVQYDNSSDEMNVQSRFRWTIQPGSDLFLILNQGFLAENGSLAAGRTEPIVKLAWTFRF